MLQRQKPSGPSRSAGPRKHRRRAGPPMVAGGARAVRAARASPPLPAPGPEPDWPVECPVALTQHRGESITGGRRHQQSSKTSTPLASAGRCLAREPEQKEPSHARHHDQRQINEGPGSDCPGSPQTPHRHLAPEGGRCTRRCLLCRHGPLAGQLRSADEQNHPVPAITGAVDRWLEQGRSGKRDLIGSGRGTHQPAPPPSHRPSRCSGQ